MEFCVLKIHVTEQIVEKIAISTGTKHFGKKITEGALSSSLFCKRFLAAFAS